MNTRLQARSWTSRTMIALGCILVASVASMIVSMFMHRTLPELLVGIWLVAIGGLFRLWNSPLNQKLFE